MTKKKFDLKNDPKFKARIKKLEGNQYCKVLVNPVLVESKELIDDAVYTSFVVAIGINDSYLVVSTDTKSQLSFHVAWTKSDAFSVATDDHERVATIMLNWLMMSANENDFVKVKHSDVNLVEIAMNGIDKLHGKDFLGLRPEKLTIGVQGVPRFDIPNPYSQVK